MILLLEFKNKLKELKEVNFLTIVILITKFRNHSELSYTGYIEV